MASPFILYKFRLIWQCANNKVQLAELERIFQRNQAQALLTAQGVTLRDPARFDLRGRLQHGQDVVIDVNVVLEGDVVLGDGVEIGANCVIKTPPLQPQWNHPLHRSLI